MGVNRSGDCGMGMVNLVSLELDWCVMIVDRLEGGVLVRPGIIRHAYHIDFPRYT